MNKVTTAIMRHFTSGIKLVKPPELGYLEGEVCNRDGCTGTINENERPGCSCHQGGAPCSSCCHNYGYCPECGWDAENEEQQ